MPLKMLHMKRNSLFLSLCLISLGATAQEALSLPEMINQALEANYDIRIVRNEQKQAENSNTIGNAGMLPRADITAEQSYSINNSKQEFVTGDSQQATAAQNEATSAQAAVRWVVFDGLAMFARKDQLEQLTLLGKTNTRYYVEQTAADLAMAYYQLKQERQLLAAYRKTLEVSSSRLTLQKKALEVGAGTALDLQRAEVDRNTDSALVLSQKAQIRELEVQINQLMNRDLETAIVPVGSFDLTSSLNLQQLLDMAAAENAQLTQQQLREMIAMEDVDIRRGALFPELELFGNYNFNRQSNEVGFLQSSRSFGPNFGVRVRFNLFNGGKDRIDLQNAKIEAENEGLRTSQVNLDIRAAVRVAYTRWENAMAQVNLEQESITKAQQTLDIATKQYELRSINAVDFRLIQLNAVNAQARYLQAQFRAKSREIELYRLSGQLMEQLMK